MTKRKQNTIKMFYVHSHLSKLCKLFGIKIQNIKRHIGSKLNSLTSALSQSYQMSHVTQRCTPPPPPQRGIPILISKTFSWRNDTDLCNWTRICFWGRFHFKVLHQTICSRGNLKNSAYVPFSSNWVLICDDYEIIDFHISALGVPFLSWHELRKNISASTIFWQNSNRWRGFSVWRNRPWGTLLVALPSLILFGQK